MNIKPQTKTAFRAALTSTLPVMAGFLFLGIAFGILLTSKGYSPILAVLMSLVCFCGSMQYVAVTLLCAAFDPLAALLMSITVNARHLFYGLSMLQKYKGLGKLKIFLVCTLCDESYSILADRIPVGVEPRAYYFAVSLLNYIYWSAATAIGSFAGHFLSRIDGFDTTGFDFVLTALFAVIFIDSCRERKNLPPAAIGVLCSAAALFIFGAEDFIIPAMLLIAAVLAIYLKVGGKPNDSQ